jgi:hypothetical protein
MSGSLRVASFARPGKLFTASSGLVLGEVGMLKPAATHRVLEAIIEMLRKEDPAEGR